MLSDDGTTHKDSTWALSLTGLSLSWADKICIASNTKQILFCLLCILFQLSSGSYNTFWNKNLQKVLDFLKALCRVHSIPELKIFRTRRDLRYFLVLLPHFSEKDTQGSETRRDLFKASNNMGAPMTDSDPALQLESSDCIILQPCIVFLLIFHFGVW